MPAPALRWISANEQDGRQRAFAATESTLPPGARRRRKSVLRRPFQRQRRQPLMEQGRPWPRPGARLVRPARRHAARTPRHFCCCGCSAAAPCPRRPWGARLQRWRRTPRADPQPTGITPQRRCRGGRPCCGDMAAGAAPIRCAWTRPMSAFAAGPVASLQEAAGRSGFVARSGISSGSSACTAGAARGAAAAERAGPRRCAADY